MNRCGGESIYSFASSKSNVSSVVRGMTHDVQNNVLTPFHYFSFFCIIFILFYSYFLL